jgi:hypothetical protein
MENIHFESVLLEGHAVAFWRYKNHVGYQTIEEVREQGHHLLAIASMAVVEARVIKDLINISSMAKPGDDISVRDVIELVRSSRGDIPIGLNPIYGLSTQKALIDCDWYQETVQFDYETAIEHANGLLCLAEAIETDSYLVSAFNDVGLVGEIRERIFDSFKKYRGQYVEN